jgi:hypothetical protein
MKIEIGKTYEITPKFKKSIVERTVYTKENESPISIFSVWRGGTFAVTIQNEDELDILDSCIGDDEEIFILDDFSYWELYETWDECANWWESDESTDVELLQEHIENNEDYFGAYEYFESKGYDEECFYSIENGIEVTEIE